MSPLLPGHEKRPAARTIPKPDAWFVGGHLYNHTAARFWMALLDEVRACFPESNRLELSAISPLPFDPGFLNPVSSLERMFATARTEDYAKTLNALVAELEWTGPPSGIHLAIYRDEDICLEGELAPDIADAETFMYLVAWLMEWAGVPRMQWIGEWVRGAFDAQDAGRGREYHVEWTLHTRALSEGLSLYTLSVLPKHG